MQHCDPRENGKKKEREESCNHFSFLSRTVVEQQNRSRENAQLDELKRERDQSTCRAAGAAGARGAEHGAQRAVQETSSRDLRVRVPQDTAPVQGQFLRLHEE